jgi:hypothetical protein
MLGAAAWGMWVVLGSMVTAPPGEATDDPPLVTEEDGTAPLADPVTAALLTSADGPLLSAEDVAAPLEPLIPLTPPEESLLVAATASALHEDPNALPELNVHRPAPPNPRVLDVRAALPAVLVASGVVGAGALVLAASAVMAQSVGRAVVLSRGRAMTVDQDLPQGALLVLAAGLGAVALGCAVVFVSAVVLRAALEDVASMAPALLLLPSEIRLRDVEGL